MSEASGSTMEAGRLTQGTIARSVIAMAAPIAIGMVFQTLYYLIDLYFVGRLGDTAIAGVSTAGNLTFLVVALSQVLSVGTVALIAQAIGRRDRADANLVFNQSLSIAVIFTLATLVLGYALAPAYMAALGADAATASAGTTYLYWYLPGIALQFALVVMNSALRGTGIVKPAILVQILTVVVNALLAPVLIAGWGTGRPLGVAGAGLATTIAVAFGVVLLGFYFRRLEHEVAYDGALVRPRREPFMRILGIGTPAGAEFAMMFVILAAVYAVIRPFGAEAQAGFGIGSRINQALFLPVMAVAFATAPVAGQNFGAGLHDRVRATFRFAAILGSVLMALMTLLCQWRPDAMVRAFTDDPQVIDAGVEYLRIISWNYVASGLIFTCSGMFQAFGNTIPSLLSSVSRLFTFVLPVTLLAHRPGFDLHHVWLMSVATTTLQALLSLWLLRREYSLKLRAVAADA
jgi:putative MATE family efflux protein